MKAFILASTTAGAAASDAPASYTPLLPVAGEPLMAHTLRWLKRNAVQDVVIVPDGEPEAIKDAIGDGSRWDLNVIYGPAVPVGTVDMLKQLAAVLDDTTVLVDGNALLDVDLGELLEYHRSRRATVTLGLRHANEPRSDVMVACDSTGRVQRIVAQPATWANVQRTATAGVAIVEPDLIDQLPPEGRADWEAEVLPFLVARGAGVYGQLLDGPVVIIREASDYEQVKDAGLARSGGL